MLSACKPTAAEGIAGAGTMQERQGRLRLPKSIRGGRTPQAAKSECINRA